jgi:hypothetical protein
LLAQVPEARQALLEHRTTNIPIDSLPPEATATVKKFVEAADDFARQVEPDYAAGGPATPISLEGRYISINNAPAVADESLAAMVIGVIHVDAGRFGMLPIYDATSPYAKAAGGIYARILDGEDPKKAYGKDQGNSAIIQAMAEAGIVADFPPDDPIFSKTVKLTRFDRGLSGAIEDICSQVEGIQIISDHFRPEPGLPDINPSGQAGQVVSQLAVFCGKKLERKGSTLLMVDREWFLKRPKEIPEALLDRLVNARRGEGLTLANAAEIAACTDEQIEASIQNHESGLLVGTGWHMRQPEVKGIARLYGSLSTEERESLDSKDGLDVSLLSQAQMALLAAAVAAAEWGHGIPESPLRLHHSARGREHEFVLTETAQTPEDNSSAQERSDTSSRFAVSWTVMLY